MSVSTLYLFPFSTLGKKIHCSQSERRFVHKNQKHLDLKKNYLKKLFFSHPKRYFFYKQSKFCHCRIFFSNRKKSLLSEIKIIAFFNSNVVFLKTWWRLLSFQMCFFFNKRNFLCVWEACKNYRTLMWILSISKQCYTLS